jgi:hypothetical protein
VIAGDNASFECISEVPVTINWLKANRPLNDELADRVKITSKGNKHTLTLLNCRDDDSGLYTAKITDEKLGVATCSAVLTVHECKICIYFQLLFLGIMFIS